PREPGGRPLHPGSEPAAAPSGGHWAFQRVVPVAPPGGKEWALLSPVDRFVRERLRRAGLPPSPPADPQLRLRRLTFDLTGLPPTPTEQDQFLADTRPDAWERVVDRLLASRAYGERWGRNWLDLARYAESNGRDRNVLFPHAWRYRDYVIESFHRDTPYDEFIREQLAGDLLPAADEPTRTRRRIATGFLTLGPRAFEEQKADRFQLDVVDGQIDTTTRVFLGLTAACARCHDHKFDPIPTREYYALAGIFASTEVLSGPGTSGNPYGHDRALQPIGSEGERLSGPWEAHQKSVAEATARRNKARSDRYRFVRQKAALETELGKLKPEAPRVAEIRKLLPELDAEIARWDARIQELDADLNRLVQSPPPSPDYAMAVRDRPTPENYAVLGRGEPEQKGEIAPRGWLSLGATPAGTGVTGTGSGRLELARWIASAEHPLTARVQVNRVWQQLFGAGLTRTADDFGRRAETPSHPELLDWLAYVFAASPAEHRQGCGWSVKRLIRLLVTTAAYGQSSRARPEALAADPENRLLWRAAPRRLEAEPLRDTLLAVSSELDREPAVGSMVSRAGQPELNEQFRITPEQQESRKRSVYLPVLREYLPESLRTFDFADPSLVTCWRSARTGADQALYLLNSDATARAAAGLGRRLLTEPAGSDWERADRLYRLTLGRRPTAAERERALRFLREFPRLHPTGGPPPAPGSDSGSPRAWAALAQALFSTAEFRTLY
ncbi:MAG: DUF1549 domain-containing protein, partial [Armatimonadetes bacterium]|nr:DUF1549 domain-containing protein [Armatimonadota bacterium]